MNVNADIAGISTKGLARVKPHPYPERRVVGPGVLHQRLLGCYGRPHGIPGPRERHQEGIPLGIDYVAACLGECVTEKPLVFREDLSIPPVAEALEEGCGALDVCEEEGDRPGRQARHVPPGRQS
jgi:hypothetical protein